MDDRQAIELCFRAFVEGSLIERNVDTVMELFSEDLMGIGMGAQGIVRCREDVRSILCAHKSEAEGAKTSVSYSDLQIRCYEQQYGSICAAVEVTVEQDGERSSSRIGQCASLRKIDGVWKIYMLQATPLSVKASDLEAYPLSFAEDDLENYRMLEQMSESMRQNTISVYKINFTTDTFEQCISKGQYSAGVEKGEKYEKAVFRSANTILNSEDRLRFIETFSLGNILKNDHEGKHALSLDYESIQPDGSTIWLRSVLHFFTDQTGQLKGYLYLINIDRQKRCELEMLHRAETDSMTGLLNREATRRHISALLKRPEHSQAGGALLMIDLDRFKQVNDTYGHGVGDRVILETASALKETTRRDDVVGRLGGDEFCVFCVGLGSRKALKQKAEEICGRIRRIRPAGEPGMTVSCSIGIARCDGGGCFEELYKRADKALYVRKKEQGRNGYTFYLD